MTKEQLIELIQKQIPDGDLITFRCRIGNDDHYFNLGYIDDSTNIGLWELRLKEIPDSEDPFKLSVEDAVLWKDFGKLEAKIGWKH